MEMLKQPYSFHGFALKLFGWKCPIPSTLVLDCHNNNVSSNVCDEILNNHKEHESSLVICCSGEQKTDMNSLKSLQNLKYVKTVVFQGWHENDGDYWTHRKRLSFDINVVPKNTEHLYIEYSSLDADMLIMISKKFPNLKTLGFGKFILSRIVITNPRDVDAIRNWKLETLRMEGDVFFSVQFLKIMPKNIKSLLLKDTLLSKVCEQQINLSETFPQLTSFGISILNEPTMVYSNFLNDIPKTLKELTFYDGGSESLNDEYVINLLTNNPNIDRIGIFTYYILTDRFLNWAINEWNMFGNKHITVKDQYVNNTYSYKVTKVPTEMVTIVCNK